MPAVATEPRVYDKIIQHLKELDKPCFVDDLPKDFQPTEPGKIRILNIAWADGIIEFGHHNHSLTYLPSHEGSSRAGKQICLLDEGMSWTSNATPGHYGRSNKHCSIPEMLDRYKTLPECYRQEKILVNKETNECRVERTKVPGNPLRLQVRLTDKGWAMLAS